MIHGRRDYDRIQDPAGLIPDDEPVFLIRGQDIAGPHALRAWCALASLAGASSDMLDTVYNLADMMDDWQLKHGSKIPDMPEGAASP